MTWRKGQCHRTHERAELAVTSLSCLSHQAAFRSKSHDVLAFNRERGIEPRRGRGWHDDEQSLRQFARGSRNTPRLELRPNPQNLRLAIAVNPLMSKAPLITCALRDGRALVLDLRALQ